MAIPSRQIGWSDKANLLWQISKQLEYLTQVMGNIEVEPVGPTTSYLLTENNDELITENNDFIILN